MEYAKAKQIKTDGGTTVEAELANKASTSALSTKQDTLPANSLGLINKTAGSSKFLREDGTWQTVSSGGGGLDPSDIDTVSLSDSDSKVPSSRLMASIIDELPSGGGGDAFYSIKDFHLISFDLELEEIVVDGGSLDPIEFEKELWKTNYIGKLPTINLDGEFIVGLSFSREVFNDPSEGLGLYNMNPYAEDSFWYESIADGEGRIRQTIYSYGTEVARRSLLWKDNQYSKESEWATSGGSVKWEDISGKPTVPSKTSQLQNDSYFINSSFVYENFAPKTPGGLQDGLYVLKKEGEFNSWVSYTEPDLTYDRIPSVKSHRDALLDFYWNRSNKVAIGPSLPYVGGQRPKSFKITEDDGILVQVSTTEHHFSTDNGETFETISSTGTGLTPLGHFCLINGKTPVLFYFDTIAKGVDHLGNEYALPSAITSSTKIWGLGYFSNKTILCTSIGVYVVEELTSGTLSSDWELLDHGSLDLAEPVDVVGASLYSTYTAGYVYKNGLEGAIAVLDVPAGFKYRKRLRAYTNNISNENYPRIVYSVYPTMSNPPFYSSRYQTIPVKSYDDKYASDSGFIEYLGRPVSGEPDISSGFGIWTDFKTFYPVCTSGATSSNRAPVSVEELRNNVFIMQGDTSLYKVTV